MTLTMHFFLCVIFGLLAVIQAQVTSPDQGTVWTNGGIIVITWGSLSGSELTIVLYRTGTAYHHTIVSNAPNTGSFSWQVEIPPQDGWPSSTSSDIVYEVDFYVNGGWNNGGQLVAKSAEFAIVWTGGTDPDPTTTTTFEQSSQGGTITVTETLGQQGSFTTSAETETLVGLTTITTVVTQVYQLGNSGLTTVSVPTTLTITNTQPTQTTIQTTQAGGTTIGVTQTSQPAFNSGMAKSVSGILLIGMGIVTGSFLIWA
jgi:hypothetical protein